VGSENVPLIAGSNGIPTAPFNAMKDSFNLLTGDEANMITDYISRGVSAFTHSSDSQK
jgi:hypothetical protein